MRWGLLTRMGRRESAAGSRGLRGPVGIWRSLGACTALGCLALTGCGSGPSSVVTYQVEGKVQLADGKPLKGGRVVFVSKDLKAPDASGEIGGDGRFALTTREKGDGAASGEFRVYIEPAAGDLKPKGRGRAPRLPFPGKYTDPDSSGLAVTVRAEPNRLEPIRLK